MNDDTVRVVGILAIVAVVMVSLGVVLLHDQAPAVQQTHAATDYFSWSCQQLKDTVNQEIAFGDAGQISYDHSYNYAHAGVLIELMIFKGCQP